MKAARLHGPRDLRVADEPGPVPDAGQSLVRVTAVGICGSDLHWWEEAGIGDALLDKPLVPGHEAAGVIAAGPRAGQRVAIDPAITCGTCPSCRRGYRNLCTRIVFSGHGTQDGTLRELMAWPSELLHPLPDGVSDAGGALLEPLGVALHAADLGHLPLGGSAAVVGCGPIGLLLIQVLRLSGARQVLAYDPLPHRRAAAVRLGADVAIDPDADDPRATPADPEAEGADVAFEVAGTDPAVQLAMDVVRPGGRVVLGGIPGDDVTRFRASVARRKGLTLAMVRRMNEAYPRAIALAAAGRVELDSLVSDQIPLSMADAAFSLAAAREGLKVVIGPSAPPPEGAGTPPAPGAA